MLNKMIRYLGGGLVRFYRRIKMILHDKRAEGQIPDHILSELARCFARDIPVFFADPANQEAYIKWLQAREQQLAQAAFEKDGPSSLLRNNR